MTYYNFTSIEKRNKELKTNIISSCFSILETYIIIMPIGIVAEVRDFTGITDEIDLPNSRIEKGLDYGRGELYSITFKTDWDTDTSHPLYKKAEMLVHYVAAYWVLDRYANYSERADQYRERAKELSMEFEKQFKQYEMVNAPSGSTTSAYSVVSSRYKTFPLNKVDGYYPQSSTIIPGD